MRSEAENSINPGKNQSNNITVYKNQNANAGGIGNSNIKKNKNNNQHSHDSSNNNSEYSQELSVQKKTKNFGISLDELMGFMYKYKERGNDYGDLTALEFWGGTDKILEILETSEQKGISKVSIQRRKDDFYTNEIFTEPPQSFCSYVWEAFDDLTIRILIIAAVVQIVLGATLSDDKSKDWIDGLSIIIAVVVVVLVGSITNWKKENKFHELNDIQNSRTMYKVMRDGIPIDIKSDMLLVGDIIFINVGDIIPADLLLISGNGLKMDESALTGESDTMNKESYSKCINIISTMANEVLEKNSGEALNTFNNKMLNVNNSNYNEGNLSSLVMGGGLNSYNNTIKPHKIPSPFIMSGTNCVEGTGVAVVIAVGDNSQNGIIKRTVENAQEDNKTPLEIKLDSIAKKIGLFGAGAGVVTFIAMSIRFIVNYVKDKKSFKTDEQIKGLLSDFLNNLNYNIEYNDDQTFKETLLNNGINTEAIKSEINRDLTDPKKNISNKILDIILLCVSIIVVAIPEGLPLAVTLSLAFSIKKLMDDQNLVRKMHACETMGGANYICTDKTGTLTKNEMNVFKILTGNKEITLQETLDVKEVGTVENRNTKENQPINKIREDYNKYFDKIEYFNLLKMAIALNVEGQLKLFKENDSYGDSEYFETKNKTDKAFIDFLYRFRCPMSIVLNKYMPDQPKEKSEEKNYKRVPFDSKLKRMTTYIYSEKFNGSKYKLFTKGGAEKVKNYCRYYMNSKTGGICPMDDACLNHISDKIEQFNRLMLRSLYICYKDIDQEQYENYEEYPDLDTKDLTFLAVFGIRDSLRNGVKEAVLKCKEASVDVIMVTGDNIVTATAIAKECHILGDGVDLNNLSAKVVEEDPDMMNAKEDAKKRSYIRKLLDDQPAALTGNSFFCAVEGLRCRECMKDSNDCQCPKTEAESREQAEKTGNEPKKIKCDEIKNIEKFKKLTKNLKVMARSQPLHKYALVLGLKQLGYVVAVTGDGTNDAPALSKSNVGFAMFDGTDIAKEASDIIILDNNFSSIVVAIIHGRNIYDNIRKFLQFQLTVNFCACLLVFICACIGNESPLSPVQMLWVNLIMDSLGSLALATESPYNELLKRKPNNREESIINGKMYKHIIFQSIFQFLILLILYLYAPKFIKEDNYIRLSENYIINHCYGSLPGHMKDLDHIIYGTSNKWGTGIRLFADKTSYDCGKYSSRQDLSVAYKEYMNSNGSTTHLTIVFNVFVIYTLFNQINARVLDDQFNIFVRITNNLFFPMITVLELILQILMIEFGNAAFKVVENGLTPKQWLISVGFSALTFVINIIVKFIPLDRKIDKWINKDIMDMEVSIEEGKDPNNSGLGLMDRSNDYMGSALNQGKKNNNIRNYSKNKINNINNLNNLNKLNNQRNFSKIHDESDVNLELSNNMNKDATINEVMDKLEEYNNNNKNNKENYNNNNDNNDDNRVRKSISDYYMKKQRKNIPFFESEQNDFIDKKSDFGNKGKNNKYLAKSIAGKSLRGNKIKFLMDVIP